jgi:DNA-directed RNA polymerase subunit RPC12/RpoP
MSVGKVTLEGYKCERCSHVWVPRKYETSQKKDPIICPKCKSPYWNKPRQEVKKQELEFKEKRKLR